MNLQISCLSENSPQWFWRVQNLVLSIRRFGGGIGGATIVAHFVGDVDERFERELGGLDVAVKVVQPFPGMAKPTNKLRMFEADGPASFDHLVALDCDVIVVDDFVDRIPPGRIGVKPADYPCLGERDWRQIYARAGLPLPESSLSATSSGEPIPPYFNSGVVTVPRELGESLGEHWRREHRDLTAWLGEDPHLIPRDLHFFADQVALALALARAGLPYEALPVGMNFPTHVPVHPKALGDDNRLSVLHYHQEVDDRGFLLRPRCTEAVAAANAFNEYRAEQLELDYEGLGSRSLLERTRERLRAPRRMLGRRHRARTWVRDVRARSEAGRATNGLSTK
jgi:hypothetical protein